MNEYTGPEVTIKANFGEDIEVEILCNTAKEALKEYIILEKEFGELDG